MSTKVDDQGKWSVKKRSYLAHLIDFDPRSMGLFRIYFGILCFMDVGQQFSLLSSMYSDMGLFTPNTTLTLNGLSTPAPLSLLYAFQSPHLIKLFCVMTMVSSLMLAVGYRTRICQVITAIGMISIHNRQQVIMEGFDLHNLWWLLTVHLPLDRRWSLDMLLASWRIGDTDERILNRQRVPNKQVYTSLARVGLIYTFFVLCFLKGIYTNAFHWLVSISLLVNPIGRLWSYRIGLLGMILSCLIEGYSQLGEMNAWWMMGGLFLLIRQEDWVILVTWFKPQSDQLTVYYDSDCGICHACARLVARLDLYKLLTWIGRSRPRYSVGELSMGEFEDLREHTIIAHRDIYRQTIWTHHQAVGEILKRIPFMSLLGRIVGSTGRYGWLAYDAFAARRHRVSLWFGYGLCGLSSVHSAQPINNLNDPLVMEHWQEEMNGPQRLLHRLCRSLSEGYYAALLILLICAYTRLLIICSSGIDQSRLTQPNLSSWEQSARNVLTPAQVHDPQQWLMNVEAQKKGQVFLIATLSNGQVIDLQTGVPPQERLAHKKEHWGFYEEQLMFKLYSNTKILWPLVIDWIKRPLRRLRLTAQDQVIELTLVWVPFRVQHTFTDHRDKGSPMETVVIRSWTSIVADESSLD